MILAVNIGNTSILLGGIIKEEPVFTAQFASDPLKTADEYALTIQGILSLHHFLPGDVEGGILSSVVPQLSPVVADAVQLLTGIEVLQVGSGIKTGLNIRTDNPQVLGSDLVANAVAALARYPAPLAIIELGTATTVSVIDKSKAYIGGMIAPGLQLSVDALSSHAAQLPSIRIVPPAKMIGSNTIERMQSGAVYGCCGMLDGLIDRVEEELKGPVTAVLTGDLAAVIAPCCKKKMHVEPGLLIRGLKILYDKNQPKIPQKTRG